MKDPSTLATVHRDSSLLDIQAHEVILDTDSLTPALRNPGIIGLSREPKAEIDNVLPGKGTENLAGPITSVDLESPDEIAGINEGTFLIFFYVIKCKTFFLSI